MSNPIFCHVPGSPYQVGDRVTVARILDEEGNQKYLNQQGEVVHLEYECGCGQRFPDIPMIGVRFIDGIMEEYWADELKLSR